MVQLPLSIDNNHKYHWQILQPLPYMPPNQFLCLQDKVKNILSKSRVKWDKMGKLGAMEKCE